MKNPVSWLEIPAIDMDRACKFYNEVFGWQIKAEQIGPLQMAVFPHTKDKHGSGGALVYHQEAYKVSDEHAGPLPYLEVDVIEETLEKIRSNGGKILLGRQLISEDTGSMALFVDSEGNRMALHSEQIN